MNFDQTLNDPPIKNRKGRRRWAILSILIAFVNIEFYWGTNLDIASTDVQQSLGQIQDLFPDEAKPPVVYKFDPSSISVIVLSVTGPMDEYRLREWAEDFIAPRLESLKGVASANVWGGQVREIQVDLDRSKLERNRFLE